MRTCRGAVRVSSFFLLLCQSWLLLLLAHTTTVSAQNNSAPLPDAWKESAQSEAAPRFLRVEYYPWHRVKEPDVYRRALERVDVLIYFKADPDQAGEITLAAGMQAHLAKLKPVLKPRTQLWLGLGSLDNIAKDDRLVEPFINQLKQVCQTNGFVGVDIDWEGESVGLADYERVVNRISRALKSSQLGVTTSVGPAPHYRQKSVAVISAVDWVNVQYYHSTLNSMSVAQMSSSLETFQLAGIPKSKLCAGLPAYGMVDTQKDKDARPMDFAYSAILQSGADPLANLWRNPANDADYHYSGTPLIKAKTRFLRQGGYRGVFTWHLGLDAPYESPGSILRAIDEANSPAEAQSAFIPR